MKWWTDLTALQTHQQHGLPFRAYVPVLMDLLEDADGMVRDTAKSTVIELFKSVWGLTSMSSQILHT